VKSRDKGTTKSAPPGKISAQPREAAAIAGSSGEAAPRRDWTTILIGAAVSLAALLLYLLTAAHDLITGDTPEFLVAAKTLGVVHAPGYPLVTFLGYLFSWLPIGSVAFRIGLLAVVCSTATVAIVYATVWRLTRLRAPAAAAGLVLATTPLFWKWSLQIETFPLNNLLVALTIFLLVSWHQNPPRRSYLIGAAFSFGLALSNQETSALLIPAIVWLLWLHRRDLLGERRTIGYAVLALIAGAIPYVYVPLAALGHSPTNWDYVHSLSAFMRLVLRRDYGGIVSQGRGAATGSNPMTRTWYLARGFGVLFGIFALLGVVYAYQRFRWYFWFVLLGVAFTGIGFMFLTNLDPTNIVDHFALERFFLLPIVIATPLVGLGVMWLGQIVADIAASFDVARATTAVAAVVVVAALVVVGVNYSTVNVSNDHVTGNFARDAVEGLKPHTILFATGDESNITTLYETQVAKIRPDVTVLLAPLIGLPWYGQVLRHNHQINVPATLTTKNIIDANPGRPVAFMGPAPDTSVNGKYYLYPVGLVSYLEKVGHPILVTQDEADNKAQLARVHVPSYRNIKADSFEPAILAHYANIPYRIGQAYQLAGQNAQAIYWFRKALAIDPSLTQYRTDIKKLGGTA